MGVREFANRYQKQVSIAGGVFTALCISVIVIEIFASRQSHSTKPPDYYFTVDDGQTWFVESSEKYPPFDYKGGQAVRAYVFQCSSGKKFVGFLERYSASTKKDLDAGKPLDTGMIRFGRELKRPGDAKWTKTGDMATETKIQNVTCPDGGQIIEVEPGD
jgi:hypothetical protein